MVDELALDRRSDTHERLLDAAAHLFGSKGYASTTTRELAATVGIQGASMYHHVSGKDDLLYALCVDSLERIAATVRDEVAAAGEALAKLRAAIDAHVTTSLADRNRHATMLTELRSLPADRQEHVITLRDSYEAFLAEVIAAAQAERSLRRDIPARQLTLALLNLLNWTIFWFRDDGDLSPSGVAEMLASLFFDGAAAR